MEQQHVEWMTAEAAARYLGVTRWRFKRLVASGHVAVEWRHAGPCVRRLDVDAYLESRRVRPGELRHLYT